VFIKGALTRHKWFVWFCALFTAFTFVAEAIQNVDAVSSLYTKLFPNGINMPSLSLYWFTVPTASVIAAFIWRLERRASLRSLPSIGLDNEDRDSWTSQYRLRLYNNSEQPMTNVLAELIQHGETQHHHPDIPSRVALPFSTCRNGVLNPKSSAALTVLQEIEKGERSFIGLLGGKVKESAEPVPDFTYEFEVRVSCMEFNPVSSWIGVKIDRDGNLSAVSFK